MISDRVQGIKKMARPTAWQHEDRVEADLVVAISGIAVQPVVGRAGNSTGLERRQGRFCIGKSRSTLDLDEGQALATGCDQVDLAERVAVATSQDSIAFGGQQNGCDPLRGDPFAKARAPLSGFISVTRGPAAHGIRPFSLRPMS